MRRLLHGLITSPITLAGSAAALLGLGHWLAAVVVASAGAAAFVAARRALSCAPFDVPGRLEGETAELERWHQVYDDALYETMDEVEAVRRADAAKPPSDPGKRRRRPNDSGYSNAIIPGRAEGRVVRTKTLFDPTYPTEILGLPEGMTIRRDPFQHNHLTVRDSVSRRYLALPFDRDESVMRHRVAVAVSQLERLRSEPDAAF